MFELYLFFRAMFDMNFVFKNKQFHVQYISFWGNMAGPLIGLVLGYVYYRKKETIIFTKKVSFLR